VAFIYYEYKPISFTPLISEGVSSQDNLDGKEVKEDWRCQSKKFTERFKREIGDCY
jgi:hypothetical protein